MTTPLLVLEKISKKYLSAGGGLEVLKDIDLQVMNGQSVAIVGPSGSGKSTLLNIVGTLDLPTSGKVMFDGQDILNLNEKEQADIRNRKIGFVFQLHHLLPQCTVLENVLVPVLVNEHAANAEQRARDLLEQVGLSERLDYRPGQLSGGERQRVAVVRAMINGPKLLVADEPTGSLDIAGADKLADLLVKMNKQHGLTLIVVTHSLLLAGRMDMVYELSGGRLVSRK
ncbi:MAG: ABC transporter ATP-binding protein [Kiritimatiellae bacterium]|nr:ABC transporter ATP-binding protein [Kiritimatiellia bacterium]MDD5520583.1 ABC transporter ATP-binding protein [Kiritimatiellia bacterium]